MAITDLSGQINGSIILLGLSFVCMQYMQARQRKHRARINRLMEAIGKVVLNKSFWEGNDHSQIKARFDLLSLKRLGNFGVELVTLFIIIAALSVLKFSNEYCMIFYNEEYFLNISRGVAIVSGVFVVWIVAAGIHSSLVRTRTHWHESAVRRYYADLKMINPTIPEL